MWQTLYRTHGMQRPTFDGLENHVFDSFVRLYDKLEDSKKQLAPFNFCELRYEDLVSDPVGQLRSIYEALKLDGFDEVLPRLDGYLETMSSYATNRYFVSSATETEITRRWGPIIQRLGYPLRDAVASHSR